MENEMMARPKPPRIIVWVVLITLALIGMMGAIIYADGTSLSIKDIIYIYESNTSTYNTVLSGARAQKYLDDSIQTHVISTVVNDSIQN